MKRRKMTKKLAAFMLALAVAFTAIPTVSGTLESHAASPYWRNFRAKATGESRIRLSWTKLTAAQRGKITGIVVYRDGKRIKVLKKTAVSYVDKQLSSDTKHSYKLRTYKKTTKKVKMYWNKKLGKWQTKKIKGARTKRVRKNKYTYRNTSLVRKATTMSADSDTAFDDSDMSDCTLKPGQTYTYFLDTRKTITWKSSNTSVATVDDGTVKAKAVGKATITATNWNGSKKTAAVTVKRKSSSAATDDDGKDDSDTGSVPTTPGNDPENEEGGTGGNNGNETGGNTGSDDGGNTGNETGGNIGTDDPEPAPVTYTGKTKTITDYLGNTESWRELSNGIWESSFTNSQGEHYRLSYEFVMSRVNNPYYNQQINGEFAISGGVMMFQQDGATFKKDDLQNPKRGRYRTVSTSGRTSYYTDYSYCVDMWGGDPSKLTYEIDHDIVNMSTWGQYTGQWNYEPETWQYIRSASGNSYLTRVLQIDAGEPDGWGTSAMAGTTRMVFSFMNADRSLNCGYESENVTITIKYNGKKIGEIVWNPNPNAVNGMSPRRALAWDIVQKAIAANGGWSTNPNPLDACREDLNKVDEYFGATYSYGETISGNGTSITAGCEGGAFVLETCSVKKYGQYGFWGCGSQNADTSSHSSWNLNCNPKIYYESQGRK